MKKIIISMLLATIFALYPTTIYANQNTQAFYKNNSMFISIDNNSCIIKTKSYSKKATLVQKGKIKYANNFCIVQNERTLVYHQNGKSEILFKI